MQSSAYVPLWSHLRRSKRGSLAILKRVSDGELKEGEVESSLQGKTIPRAELLELGKDAV
jgi:hypothetical protein